MRVPETHRVPEKEVEEGQEVDEGDVEEVAHVATAPPPPQDRSIATQKSGNGSSLTPCFR